MQPERSSEFLHSIAIRLAVSTADGYFLVLGDKSNPQLPYMLLKKDENSRDTAMVLLDKITGIDLMRSTWLQLRFVGFFETPTEPDRTLLFAVEMPERCTIHDRYKWLSAEELFTCERVNLAWAGFHIACKYKGGQYG